MNIKNYDDFKKHIKNCTLPTAEGDFVKPVNCPYITYFRSDHNAINADGQVIFEQFKISIELYTNKQDTTSEDILEKWMRENGIIWNKNERLWDSTNKLCIAYYEFWLNANGILS